MRVGAFVVMLLALPACGSERGSEAPADAGADDSIIPADDAGASEPTDPGCDDCTDAGVPDAGGEDGSAPEPPDTGSTDAGTTSPLRVYMAATGDDLADGLSAAKAVRTLARVQKIVIAAGGGRDVEVRIAPGTYYGDSVVWTYTMKDHAITFLPADGTTRPVFDGCASATGACATRTWFTLNAAMGRATNIHIRYVQVQRYTTAISFNGNRDDFAAGWNGYNEIFGCTFDRIGNGYAPTLPYSTAAVRLVNSDHNRIANNHFVDVINTVNGGALHDIYAAHNSSNNVVTGNRFQRCTGDPVRFRDFSNDNDVLANRFVRVGTGGGYSDWYCDHEARTDCTKPTPECPSWNNEFRDNSLDGTWTCTKLPTFVYYQDDTTTGCAKPTSTSVRLSTSGNTQTATPCTAD